MLDYEQMGIDLYKSMQDTTGAYFIERYLSTFNASAGKSMPFKLFPRQRVFLKSIAENKASVAIKCRQSGITTLSSGYFCYKMVFAPDDTPETILCIANKLDLSQQIVDKVRTFLQQVPRWMWGDEYYSPDPKSDKNKKDIFVKNSKNELELFNGCKLYARSSSPNAARGISAVSLLIFDEAAFIEDALAVYSSAVAATASCPHSKIIMVSTPNGKDELYYNTYKQALAKENNYNAVEFRWYQDPRYNKFLKWVKKDSEGNDDIIEDTVLDDSGTIPYDEARWKSLEQQGYKPTSPWYEDMCKSFNNDSMKIAQELDVSFMGSANNVVESKYIEMQQTLNVRDPLTDMTDPLVEETWFWKPPIEGHRYICSIDPSRGISSDRTAIEMIDMDGLDENGMPIIEQVMEYVGKKLGDEIGQIAYNYATLYNNALIVIDCTGGCGDAAALTLIRMNYKNLYYEDNTQKNYTIQNNTRQGLSYENRLPGFHFQGNRYPILSNLAGMVRNNEFKIRSIRVINELDTWIFEGDTGRMNHMSSSHDDTLTSLAMGLFVMRYSVNRLEELRKKDSAILSAYIVNKPSTVNYYKSSTSVDMRPKNSLPYYSSRSLTQTSSNVNGNFMWLISKRR